MAKIIQKYPPNYKDIKKVLDPPLTACFAYGDKIYFPNGTELAGDLLIHEAKHEEQQKILGPKKWWAKYLDDLEFRKGQEVEAYATQYNWVKDKIPEKMAKRYLELFAHQLSNIYKLDLDFNKAFTLIRLKAKEYGTN